MEHNNTEIGRGSKRQVLFLILLAIAIGALLFTSIILIRNAKEIKSNPVQYAIDNDFYDSCSCFIEGKGVFDFGRNTLIEPREKETQNWTRRNN